jgi:NADPH:quinone reductase-like Zn-dependent oxidoreductase
LLAAFVETFSPDASLSALRVGERPEPVDRPGWAVIEVKAASLNFHDVLSLRGIGPGAANLPMTLGCDVAGLDSQGREVVVHSLIASPGWERDELADPNLSVFSERYQGTFAERVAVPIRNILAKPIGMSFSEAACLPVAWLTAYRMLFTLGRLNPGDTVLVQGASGGLSSALIRLGKCTGLTVWVTGRDERSRRHAEAVGADQTFEVGARLPDRVDAVMDSVGAATWAHSLRSLRTQGRMVVPGGTSGFRIEADIARIISRQLQILGAFMGSLDEFRSLLALCTAANIKPDVHVELPLCEAAEGIRLLLSGGLSGKVVLIP